MTAEALRQALANGLTHDQFHDLAATLRRHPADEVFGLLWPLALDGELVLSQYAGWMLAHLEPRCPLPAEDALRAVAASELNLSWREVPFYLGIQFGKPEVARAIRVVAAEYPAGPPPELSGVAYWLGYPAVELVKTFVEWRSRWGCEADAKPRSVADGGA